MRVLLRYWIPVLLAGLVAACQINNPTPSRVEAPADSAAGEVSFELAGPGGAALVVPVHLNGEGPYTFVLDTGATLTCLEDTLARSLGLPERRGQVGYGATLGSSGSVRLVAVDSLRVGATRAFDLTACTIDLGALEQSGLSVDGLLGLNFLQNFRVTLDFERRILHLQEP